MTVKDRQCLLTFLKKADGTSYYTGEVDGIYGRLSRKAIEDFQKDFCGLIVTGEADAVTDQAMIHAVAFGIPERDPEAESDATDNNVGGKEETTGTFWDEIEFFDREEFRCQCGGKYCNGFPNEPHEATVRYANAIRKRLGVPTRVNSGLRCPTWNSIQGGVVNSNHMTGGAVDLGCPAGVTPEAMRAAAEAVMGNTGGIGIYNWGIHIDDGVYSRWDERT